VISLINKYVDLVQTAGRSDETLGCLFMDCFNLTVPATILFNPVYVARSVYYGIWGKPPPYPTLPKTFQQNKE